MDVRGFFIDCLWIFVDFHGFSCMFLWMLMDFHGFSLILSLFCFMDAHWFYKLLNGFVWMFIDVHGCSWVCHGCCERNRDSMASWPMEESDGIDCFLKKERLGNVSMLNMWNVCLHRMVEWWLNGNLNNPKNANTMCLFWICLNAQNSKPQQTRCSKKGSYPLLL